MTIDNKFYKLLLRLNIAQILIGLVLFGFSLLQFSAAALDNGSLIDFRILNTVHAVTGAIGTYMILKQCDPLIPKSLYCLGFILSLWTLIFYSDTLAQESFQLDSMREIRRLDGGDELISDDTFRNHWAKLAICSIMILLALAGIAMNGMSYFILEKSSENRFLDPSSILSSSNRRIKQQMSFVAVMKITCGLATICLGSYLEALYKKKTAFMKIGWQIFAGSIAILSGFLDLRALHGGKKCDALNLKISLIFSVVASVLTLKTLDYCVSNYFVGDLREYSRFDELRIQLETTLNNLQINSDSTKQETLVKFIVHAAVIGALALSFAHSIISAIEAGSLIEQTGKTIPRKGRTNPLGISDKNLSRGSISSAKSNFEAPELNVFIPCDESLHKHKTCAGILQCICGLFLIILCVLSLISWDFSKGYDGGVGVLWLGCLFIASGLINTSRPKTFAISVYVLSVVAAVLSLERAIFSFNVVYQATKNSRFQAELEPLPSDPATEKTNHNMHAGRITLHSIESVTLSIEFLASSWTCLKFTQAILQMPPWIFAQSKTAVAKCKGTLCSLGIFHLLYAFVTIAVSVAAEVALWSFNVNTPYLVNCTNGVVVLAVVFVQWLSSQHYQFLHAAAMLNAVAAAVAFFVMAPAMRELYTLVAGYKSMYDNFVYPKNGMANELIEAELKAKPIQEWIIGMNVLIVLLSIVEFVISVISGMICNYLMRYSERVQHLECKLQWPSGQSGHRRSVNSSLAAGIDLEGNEGKNCIVYGDASDEFRFYHEPDFNRVKFSSPTIINGQRAENGYPRRYNSLEKYNSRY